MTIIGTFEQVENGYSGALHTLTRDIKLSLTPNEPENKQAPAYRITREGVEVGAALYKEG